MCVWYVYVCVGGCVYRYVCMYGHVCIRIHMRMLVCVCVHVYRRVQVGVHVCVCLHVESIYAGMCMHRFIHALHRHVHVWTCTQVCIYTHTQIYTYIHAHVYEYVCMCMCWWMRSREVLFITGHRLPGNLVKLATDCLEILLKCRFWVRMLETLFLERPEVVLLQLA